MAELVLTLSCPDRVGIVHAVAAQFAMDWELHDVAARPRVLIMVSKAGHCLNDLLYRRPSAATPSGWRSPGPCAGMPSTASCCMAGVPSSSSEARAGHEHADAPVATIVFDAL
jgi:hypothetical protein